MANGGQMPDWLIPAAAGVPSGAPSIPTPGTNMALKVNTTNGHLYAYIASAWIDVTGTGSGGALTYLKAQLSADVAMTTASTTYDGPSLSLVAGTWLLIRSMANLSEYGMT